MVLNRATPLQLRVGFFCSLNCPCGAANNISDFGSDDRGFESLQGYENALVVQRIEHQSTELGVEGSSPSRRTNIADLSDKMKISLVEAIISGCGAVGSMRALGA